MTIKEKVAELLLRHRGEYISGEEMARHLGLINAIELVEDRESKQGFAGERRMGYQIYQRALKRGLLLRPLGNVLYFNPPLVIEENEMDAAVERCAAAVGEILPE